jgi:spore coat protein U-like protein
MRSPEKEVPMKKTIYRMVLCTALAAPYGLAVTDTDTFLVTATVSDSCTVTAGDLAFGTYNTTALVDTTGTSTVTVNCTLATPYTITLDVGSGSGAAYDTGRIMTGSPNTSETLNYNLYTDVLHTTIWGDGVTGGSGDVDGIGTGLDIPHVVYGVIGAGQNVKPQSYSDTVTATLTY